MQSCPSPLEMVGTRYLGVGVGTIFCTFRHIRPVA